MANKDLEKAKNKKADEFYTQLPDIEQELKHYKDHFKGKTVFCNCDDPYWSDFFFYFVAKFNMLGIKKLITTHYIDNDIPLFADVKPEKPYSLSITKAPQDLLSLERPAMVTHIIAENGGRHYLKGDGDFRSAESIEMLKEADIVVTNPPFSLFREYVAQLIEYEKKFIIIGNINAATYKETFKLIQENKIWLGYSIHSGDREFRVPDSYPLQAAGYRVDENGIKYIRVKGVRWFTNLDYPQRHEDLVLYKKYSKDEFPKYDNYDAIEVSKTADIPSNYNGLMCVPITFLDKYNPDQFEILGITDRQNTSGLRTKKYTSKDTPKYNDLNARGVLLVNGNYKPMYARLIIKRKG